MVVWFIDQNSKPLEIEDKINITLVTHENVKYKKMMRYLIELRDPIFVKCYGLLFLVKNGQSISKNLSNKYSQRLLDYA